MGQKIALAVSPRGQLTLPATLRKKLGLFSGGMIVIDEHEGTFRLQPAAVVGIRLYSDEQVKEFTEAERISPEEAHRLREKIRALPKKKPAK
jgi:antitoxin PrlF